jgi:hypothetical protein
MLEEAMKARRANRFYAICELSLAWMEQYHAVAIPRRTKPT